jgi:hypothetical protein
VYRAILKIYTGTQTLRFCKQMPMVNGIDFYGIEACLPIAEWGSQQNHAIAFQGL